MIVIYAIVSRDVLLKHLVFQIWGEVKISGLTDFSDPGQVTNEGRKFILLALMSVDIS